MKIRKRQFSTCISDLWGRDNYQSHITVGREYWWKFLGDSDVYRLTHKFWHKIKITYIRSGCMFYIITDAPEIEEQFCPINCFFAASLILAELNPIEDLGESLGDIEVAKLKYCFNDDITVIKDWPNEREIELDDEYVYLELKNTYDYLEILTMKI